MMKGISLHTNALFVKLAALKRPEEILQLFFRLCTDSELAELGLRFQADMMVRKRLPLDEILSRFPDRADVVARVLIHHVGYARKAHDFFNIKPRK